MIMFNGMVENVVVNEQIIVMMVIFKNKVFEIMMEVLDYMIIVDQLLYFKICNSLYIVVNGEDVIIRGIVVVEDLE